MLQQVTWPTGTPSSRETRHRARGMHPGEPCWLECTQHGQQSLLLQSIPSGGVFDPALARSSPAEQPLVPAPYPGQVPSLLLHSPLATLPSRTVHCCPHHKGPACISPLPCVAAHKVSAPPVFADFKARLLGPSESQHCQHGFVCM